MLAERTKPRGYLGSAEKKHTRTSVYEFPIKGGIVKRGLRRPTPKISFKIVRPIVEGLLRAVVRLEIKDKENLPKKGAVIAVFNHLNLIDPPLHIISILPRDSIIMAKEELFYRWPMPVFRMLMDVAEAYPVRRRGTVEERRLAIKYAEEVLDKGLVFGIYPEGTRSKVGCLKEAYTGCALIAVDTGIPLIPVSIRGTEKLKGIGWVTRPTVTITFGKPFTLPPIHGKPTEQKLRDLTEFIMSKLAGALPPEYRGRYKPC
jgi:1-acyl-sn-glycerol-3-phosphate acyltransferase